MPFAGYKDFDECVRKNKDKEDPKAYCAEIKRKTEKSVQSVDIFEEGESDTPAIDALVDKFAKGGPGSGVKGHTTQRFDDRDKWVKSLSKKEQSSLNSWMRNGYEWLRKEDKTEEGSEELTNLKSALSTAPLYHQSISKGIRADIKIKVGETIEMSALSSFSTNVAVAKEFAVKTPGGKALPVSQKFTILKIDNHDGGPQLPMKSIAGTYETEVVMEKGRKFEVVSIEKQVIKRPSLGRGKPPRQYKGKVLSLREVST